jgi:hypothetical protein
VDSRTTVPLEGMWGSGPADIWAVGNYGTILHYTGSSWSDLSTGSGWFMGVWGSGPDDAWIVGTTTFRHWDGTAWTALAQTIPSMYEISGTSATDVWAVGANGEIQHCGP